MRSTVLALATGLAFVAFGVAPAYGHAEVDATSPVAPGPLASCPSQIQLHFSEAVAIGGLKVQAGTTTLEVAPADDGRTQWIVKTDGACSSAVLELAWKSASADDGHVAAGQLHFDLAKASPSSKPSASPARAAARSGPGATALAALVMGTIAMLVVGLTGLRGRRVR